MNKNNIVGLAIIGMLGVCLAVKALYNKGWADGKKDTILKTQEELIKVLTKKEKEAK